MRKHLRNLRSHERPIATAVAKLERQGLSLTEALRAVSLDTSLAGRATAAAILSDAGDDLAVRSQLELFFQQTEKDDLFITALTLEHLSDLRAVQPLVRALLEDENPHRRRGAARALGWMGWPGRAAVRALGRCVADPVQPQPAREEAAESLSYVGTRETIDALISALSDPDAGLRFWAVFGLGGTYRRCGDNRCVAALESMLGDNEVAPGNCWWSVGKEALAMLGTSPRRPADYRSRLEAQIQQVLTDPNASAADRRWADCYSDLEAGPPKAKPDRELPPVRPADDDSRKV